MSPPPKPFFLLFLVLPLLLSPAAPSPFVLSASFSSTLRSALSEVRKISSLLGAAPDPVSVPGPRRQLYSAVHDCLDLLDETADELSWALSAAENRHPKGTPTTADRSFDIHSWLSAALGNQDTCKEGLREAAAGGGNTLDHATTLRLDAATSLIASSLHEVASQSAAPVSSGGGRKLMGFFPEWVSAGDRRLMAESSMVATAVVVVAQDGSRNYTTVTEAVEAAPAQKMERFVIYVKEGLYLENVEVPKKKWNVMLVGEGMDRTIISGNRSVAGGWTTFRSATLAARGRGFIAWNLAIENTAGSEGNQAVALRSSSDLSVFYRCNISGYQDTLYAHSLRHFYRECHVTGTVDFIFGEATAVFQDCFVLPRYPHTGHTNTITAQARKSPDQNNGFSFQFCNVTAAADLIGYDDLVATYLGRPWRPYSRVVFMQSYIGSVVRPEGWLEWSGSDPEGLDTLYYGEFSNDGPGSAVDNRVNWTGYHVITDPVIADEFTVAKLLEGDYWLPATGVHYTAGLDT